MQRGMKENIEKKTVWNWPGGGVALRVFRKTESRRSDNDAGYPAGTCRMVFCIQGCLLLCPIDDDSPTGYRITPDRAVLFYHPRPHAPRDDTSQCARMLSIHFSAQPLLGWLGDTDLEKRLKRAIEANRPLRVMKYLNADTVAALARAVAFIEGGCGPSLQAMIGLLELVWRFAGSPDPTVASGVRDSDRHALAGVCATLERNLDRPPSLKALAAQAGMSVSKLKLLFPQVYGITPYAYLRRLRMHKAYTLLTTSGMNVTEVALEVGYSSLSHFSRTFAECYGVFPSRLRLSKPSAESDSMKPDRHPAEFYSFSEKIISHSAVRE